MISLFLRADINNDATLCVILHMNLFCMDLCIFLFILQTTEFFPSVGFVRAEPLFVWKKQYDQMIEYDPNCLALNSVS